MGCHRRQPKREPCFSSLFVVKRFISSGQITRESRQLATYQPSAAAALFLSKIAIVHVNCHCLEAHIYKKPDFVSVAINSLYFVRSSEFSDSTSRAFLRIQRVPPGLKWYPLTSYTTKMDGIDSGNAALDKQLQNWLAWDLKGSASYLKVQDLIANKAWDTLDELMTKVTTRLLIGVCKYTGSVSQSNESRYFLIESVVRNCWDSRCHGAWVNGFKRTDSIVLIW